MQNRARVITRRIAVAAAGVAMVGAGVAFNLPANAEPGPACPQLVAAYVSTPSARAQLLPLLISNQCTIPTSSTSSSSTSSSSTTSSSTTSTTANPASSACGPLATNYLSTPSARPELLPLFAQFGCRVPTIPGSTTSSSSTSSTSSTSSSTSSTITVPTIPTIPTNTAICPALLSAYLANPNAQQALLPALLASGCGVTGVSVGE